MTITAPKSTGKPLRNRKYIVLTARVHPGETNSSFKMHGCIKFLIGDSERAKYL